MAFRATNIVPATAYNQAKKTAVQLKQFAQNRSAALVTGANSAEILSIADNINSFKNLLNSAASVPGIAAYAEAQEDDPLYDVVAEFNGVIAAIDAVINEIVTTMPADSNDWLLINKINLDGSLTPRDFTALQVANLKTLIDAVDAAIV